MEKFNFDFYDWGSWGVGDLYNGNEELLKNALESGEDFDTEWHGFKKELESMRITRDSEGITVYVSAYMDSALEEWDLIMDGITEEEAEKLTDEIVEEIREYLYENSEYCEECEYSETISATSTFEEIMAKASEIADRCHEQLRHSFQYCAWITLYILNSRPKDTTFIYDRIKSLR